MAQNSSASSAAKPPIRAPKASGSTAIAGQGSQGQRTEDGDGDPDGRG